MALSLEQRKALMLEEMMAFEMEGQRELWLDNWKELLKVGLKDIEKEHSLEYLKDKWLALLMEFEME